MRKNSNILLFHKNFQHCTRLHHHATKSSKFEIHIGSVNNAYVICIHPIILYWARIGKKVQIKQV